MAVDFVDIFRPCAILYPTSPTIASTSPKKIHEWFIYRVYILLLYIAVAGTPVAQMYNNILETDGPWTIKNKSFLLTIHSAFYTILLAQSMMRTKNKLKKLMDRINEIDVDYSINDRKYKKYNAIFVTILVVGHVGGIIVSIIYSGGTFLFFISLGLIDMLSDVEILVFTCFACILNAKMAHLTLKLENIVKNKEASKEDFYERYRQGLHVVKRINSLWQGRMFMIIIFELYSTTRMSLQLFAKEKSMTDVMSVFIAITKYTMSIRHVVIYTQLGLVGQWVAVTFHQISQLANTISDMDLGEELNHQMMKISRIGAVSPGRLYAGSLTIDGHLPLKAVSAVISTVILLLQFGVSVF